MVALSPRRERTRVDADWVIERLRDEATYQGENASHAARVAALNLLGKHVGLFREVAPPAPVTFVFSGLERQIN